MEMTIFVVIFCGAIAQDLLWRKVKNYYVVAALVAAFLFQWSQLGFVPSLSLYQNFILALIIGIGLYLTKVLGAGDVKIFAAMSLLLPLDAIPIIYFYSLFWGALFGVLRYAVSGKILILLQNIFFISNSAVVKSTNMQPIPFTVAFLLGALTDWTLRRHGVSLL